MPFVKGRSGNPTGKRKANGKPPWPTLAAMRRVVKQPAAEDKTELERELRKLFKDDMATFLQRYHDAEAKWKAGLKASASSTATAGVGAESADSLPALIDRILAEIGEKPNG
jgi:hypothetical protein